MALVIWLEVYVAELDGTIPAFDRTWASMLARWAYGRRYSVLQQMMCTTHSVSVQRLEEVDDYLEEGNSFLPGLVT